MDERTLVLVGTGAYVTRDGYGPGVVGRSLAQWCVEHAAKGPWRVIVLHRSRGGRDRFEREWKSIEAEIGDVPPVEFEAITSSDVAHTISSAHALFICVPDAAHAEYIELGVAAQVPVWIVKPMTGEGAASENLAEAAERSGTPVWVDYHKRFDVSNRSLRQTIEDGSLGRPLLYSVRYSQPRDLPLDAFAWSEETDVFTYIGCHYVDQLFFVMPGLEITRVEASGVSGPVHAKLGGVAYDTVLAHFEGAWHGHPVAASFEVGWSNPLASPTKSLQVVEVTLERGRLFMDQMRRGTEVWSDEEVQIPNPYFFSRVYDPIQSGTRYHGYGYDSVRHFLDFTVADESETERLASCDALPWAREAVRTDHVLAAVRSALEARSAD